MLRKLREELRNEEMKLVLLKKLKQSQQMKENIAVLPATHGAPASKKLPPPQSAPPPLMRTSKPASSVPPLLRGVRRLQATLFLYIAHIPSDGLTLTEPKPPLCCFFLCQW